MKLLVVFLLIGTMMVLTRGSPEPEPGPEPEPEPEPEAEAEAEPEPEAEAEAGADPTKMPEVNPPDVDNEGNQTVFKRSSGCNRYRDNTWYRYGDSYYVYITRGYNWVTAQRVCLALRGSLVSLRNRAEEAFVKRLTKNRIVWIGLSDAQMAGHWLWIGGTKFRYHNFCRGQPSNGKRKTVALMNVSSRRCWYDYYATARFHFVCSRKVR